jgi:hypothetical protein
VRLRDGEYECGYCGKKLRVPADAHPQFIFTAHSGEPNVRHIRVGTREIHHCEVSDERLRI